MIDIEEFLLRFSLISCVIYFLRRTRKKICCMGLTSHPWISSFFQGSLNSTKLLLFTKNSKRQPPEAAFSNNDHNNLQEKQPIISPEKKEKPSMMSRKRPAQLILPGPAECQSLDFAKIGRKLERNEYQVEGRGFSLASKKGKREVMEDGHGIMLDISGNPKQVRYHDSPVFNYTYYFFCIRWQGFKFSLGGLKFFSSLYNNKKILKEANFINYFIINMKYICK